MTAGIVGLGLIGGSFARALREKGHTVFAYDADYPTVLAAKAAEAIDAPCTESALSASDFIIIALYPSAAAEFLEKNADVIPKSATVIDACGTKRKVCEECGKIAEAHGFTFIGGHPMCGSEKTGFSNATEYLLENAYYIITPTAKTAPAQLEDFHALVKSLGSVPMILDYEKHDFATAAISHLPHIIASSLVNLVSDLDDEQETMRTIAAGGFKDITRIASSSPVMWQNICLSNQEQILKLTDCYIHALQNIRSSVADAKSDDIISFFQSAKDYRDSITTPVRGSLQKNYSVYCDLVDEAGAIPTLATIMASHNISIKNIGILHNREYEDGVLQIEFYEEDALEKAVKLMEDNHYVVHRR